MYSIVFHGAALYSFVIHWVTWDPVKIDPSNMNKRRMSSTQPPNKERSCCSFSFKSNAQAEYPAFSQHVFTLWLAPKQSRQCRVCVPGNVMTGAGGEEKTMWERNWQLDTTCINLWVFQSTSCLFMQFQDVSCRFHQFPRSLSRWNLRAMFVNNSTFCSAWNHLQSCRGDRNKTYYEMPKHDPCQRHNSSWWYMLILYRWIKIACDPVYNGWAQCSWHLELEHSPKKYHLH